MKLTDIISPRSIVPRLSANDRDAAVTELVDALVAAGQASSEMREDLVRRVIEREKRGSTGFGRGVAVPHVKHKGVTKMSAALGLSARGVDFNSLDRQPVYTIFLLLSPDDKPEEHLQAMEVIFMNLSKESFRMFLRQATKLEEVIEVLQEADAQQLG
ncbi:MAG: PTS sugar transporter subunit IIA [Planctomycetota bacterium]|nr:PTS sugar transporter subunit IIA [Planctomycetota bacterium]